MNIHEHIMNNMIYTSSAQINSDHARSVECQLDRDGNFWNPYMSIQYLNTFSFNTNKLIISFIFISIKSMILVIIIYH